MFKFNFFDEENREKIEEEKTTEEKTSEFGEIDLEQLNEFENERKEKILEQIESIQSDLIPSVYEGLMMFANESRRSLFCFRYRWIQNLGMFT